MDSHLNSKNDVLKNTVNALLDFLYPENIMCIICDKPINKDNTYSMCKSCFENIHFIVDGCIKCGKPIVYRLLEEQDISGCSYCLGKSFYFDKAISCVEYTDFSKDIIYSFKYSNKTYISKYIAKIMSEKLELEEIVFDYIMFVPLHKKRYKKRGFNQAQKIAKYLGEIIDKPVIDCIIRVNNTKRLYTLNKEERKRELKNVFKINNNKEILKNKNILIVDDIFTTGSTVNEISKLLKLNEVNKIYIVSFLTRNN